MYSITGAGMIFYCSDRLLPSLPSPSPIQAIQGRSGLVVTRLPAAREHTGSRRAAGKSLCFHEKSLRHAALGTGCTLTAVPRSTQPSTLRGTVNEYQPYG